MSGKNKPIGSKECKPVGGKFGKYVLSGDDKCFKIIECDTKKEVLNITPNCTTVPDELKAGLGCLLLADIISIGSSGAGATIRNNIIDRIYVPTSTAIASGGEVIEQASLPVFEVAKWEDTSTKVDTKADPIPFVYDFVMPQSQCVHRTAFYPAESCKAIRFILIDKDNDVEIMNLILTGGSDFNTEIKAETRTELRFIHSVLVGGGTSLNVKYINMDTDKPILVYPSTTNKPYESIYRSNYRNKEIATSELVYDENKWEDVIENKEVGGFFLPSIEECRYAYQYMSSDVSIYGMEDDFYWTSSYNTKESAITYNFKNDEMRLAGRTEIYNARPFVIYDSNGKDYPIGSKGKFNGFVVCMSDDKSKVMEMSSQDIRRDILTNKDMVGKGQDAMWTGLANNQAIVAVEGVDEGVAKRCIEHTEQIIEEIKPRNGKLVPLESVNHIREELLKAGLHVLSNEELRPINKPYLLEKRSQGGDMPLDNIIEVGEIYGAGRTKFQMDIVLNNAGTACITSTKSSMVTVVSKSGNRIKLDQFFLTKTGDKFMHSIEYPKDFEPEWFIDKTIRVGIDFVYGKCCYMWIDDYSTVIDVSELNEDAAYRNCKLESFSFIGDKTLHETAKKISNVYFQVDSKVVLDLEKRIETINLRMADEFGNIADVTDKLVDDETICVINMSSVELKGVTIVQESNDVEFAVDPVSNVVKVKAFTDYYIRIDFASGKTISGFRFFSCPFNTKTITIMTDNAEDIKIGNDKDDLYRELTSDKIHLQKGDREKWDEKANREHKHSIADVTQLEERIAFLEEKITALENNKTPTFELVNVPCIMFSETSRLIYNNNAFNYEKKYGETWQNVGKIQ